MSFASHREVENGSTSSWHGSATILEALLLLVFLLAAIALVTKTLALSYAKADEGRELSAATMVASNTAELFAADPTDPSLAIRSENGFRVICDVNPTRTAAGTVYNATIKVFDENGQTSSDALYTLTTSKYASEVQ